MNPILQALKNEKCRRTFWEWCLYYDYDFFTNRPFLKKIADGFQLIYESKIHSLSASLPPRAGKSYITSLFCAFWLGNRSDLSVLRCTCTSTLYDKLSYDTRAIMRSEKFKEVFPVTELSPDKQNINAWNTTQSKQVGYFGAGVGGTIIGFGANIAITDDLYKSIDDAMSETVNDTVHRWKQSAFDSRKEKNCPLIDIGTRWTKKDVIGSNMEAGHYDVSIVIPALVDEKSFCENVKTTEEYLKIRKDLLPEIWAGEYMQEPAELEGLLFKKSDLKRFKIADLPKEKPHSILGYSDIADDGEDFYSMPVAYVYRKQIFIIDALFTRENVDITLPATAEMIKKHNINYVRVEGNNQGSIFIKMLRQKVEPSKVLMAINRANKDSRIRNEYGFIKEYCYFLDETEIAPGSHYDQFMRNLFAYMKNGTAKHDDAPDSLAGLCVFIQGFLGRLFT
jgi:predicted phage terminase large subunit-like protein